MEAREYQNEGNTKWGYFSTFKLKKLKNRTWELRRAQVILPPAQNPIREPFLLLYQDNTKPSARRWASNFKWLFLLWVSPLSSSLKMCHFSILLPPPAVFHPRLLILLPCASCALSLVPRYRRSSSSSRSGVPEVLWSPAASLQKWLSSLVHRRSLVPKRLSAFGPILRSIISRSLSLDSKATFC